MMTESTMAEIVRHQDPLTVGPGATIQEACGAMHKRRVGAVLVVDKGKLAGIFTGRDAVHVLATGLDPGRTLVGQVMTRNLCTLRAHHHAIDALRLMDNGGFRHLPIVEEGRVLGIVSRYDFRAEDHRRMDEETGFFEILR